MEPLLSNYLIILVDLGLIATSTVQLQERDHERQVFSFSLSLSLSLPTKLEDGKVLLGIPEELVVLEMAPIHTTAQGTILLTPRKHIL